jgi:hypothetical protein
MEHRHVDVDLLDSRSRLAAACMQHAAFYPEWGPPPGTCTMDYWKSSIEQTCNGTNDDHTISVLYKYMVVTKI